MTEWIMNFPWNGWLGILLYWVPLAFCVYGYLIRTWTEYQKDKTDRETKPKYYIPSVRIGHLIGRAVVTLVPVANLFAAIFDLGPEVFRKFIDWLSRVFDQPLVPPRKDVE